jgi:hypothetical protein
MFHPLRRLRWTAWLPLLGVFLYAAVLARYTGACAAGSDSSGYLNNARLLSEARLTVPMRRVPGMDPASLPSYTHVPLGFIPNPDRLSMTPTYPMGLPLLVAATARMVGWDLAPALIMGLHALCGLVVMYLLGRQFGLGPGWAWIGALLLGANSLYLMMSLQLMSDVPATVWLGAAVLCSLKSGARWHWAFAAGIALSVAVLVRPTNLLGIVPIGLALGFSLRRWLLLFFGGLPGAVFLGFVNHTIYGSILTTGYGGFGWMFSPGYVSSTLLHYGHWLPVLLTPLIALALGLPFLWRRQPVQTSVLAAWSSTLLVFYMFYSVTHDDWWYLRFILPAFPPLLLAALLVASALAARFKLTWQPGWFALATVAILIYAGVCFHHFHVPSAGRNERLYPEMAAWMKTHLPADALVASMQTSGALLYYTQFAFFRWDQVSPGDFQRIAGACASARMPIYAALFPFEIEEDNWAAFRKHLGSGWTQVGAVRYVTIWRYDPSGTAK